MAEQLEAEIEQTKQEISMLKGDLDRLAQAYTDQAKADLPAFFESWMARIVSREATAIQALGVEGIKTVKQELKAFTTSIPSLVDDAMPKPDQLWHHITIPTEIYDMTHEITSRGGEGMQTRLRAVAGPFGAILIRHKLAVSGHQKEWEGAGTSPRYSYGLDFPKSIATAQANYFSAFKKLVEKNRQLKLLETRKTERDAKKMWDGA